jgi:hypothetical protein
MYQAFNPLCKRALARPLSGYFSVLAALFLTLVAPHAYAAAACNVVYTISPQNSSAFGAAITIQNTGTTAWTSWSLTWTFANGQTVSSLWNGIETQSGANVTVKNEPYNGSVAAGGTVSGVGFNGTWNGTTNAVPASFAVNGVTCGAALTATTTMLTASTTTPAVGASVTLTATVAPSAATGTVTFYSGTTSLGTGTLSAGVATLATSFATAGTYSLTAKYAGSTSYTTSTSSAVSVTASAKTATTTALAASTTTPAVGASITLTATVAPTAATGTVTFYSGTTSLGIGTLSAGKATLATSFATAGTYSLTAVYAGSTTYATSTSSAVSITVGTPKTATTTALTASTITPKVGASVTLTATVAPSTATGTVTFYSGTTSLGTGTLSCGQGHSDHLVRSSGDLLAHRCLRRLNDLRDQYIRRRLRDGYYYGHHHRADYIHHHAKGWRQRHANSHGCTFNGHRHSYILFGHNLPRNRNAELGRSHARHLFRSSGNGLPYRCICWVDDLCNQHFKRRFSNSHHWRRQLYALGFGGYSVDHPECHRQRHHQRA